MSSWDCGGDGLHDRGLTAADIPGFDMSSGSCVVVGPGDGFVVGGMVLEAAVVDTDEAVGELAKRGLVADVSGARRG
jgi:hypothetical protein